MYSQMFRRETARRLLGMTGQVLEIYHDRRYPWLMAYQFDWREATQTALTMIANAVGDDDIGRHEADTAWQTKEYLDLGMPPIAILAAEDLLHEIILSLLTTDQQGLVSPLLHAGRVQRQGVIQDHLSRQIGLRGA